MPGSVSVNAETVLFEPDLQHECVREFGVGEYQIFLEVRDVIDCGSMAMPLEDEQGQVGDKVAYFLQLHVRTLDGRQFCQPEDAEHAWCVVFWMRSREELQETARCLIAHLDDLRRPGMPPPSRKRSHTSVPYACLDCMSEFEAAAARRQRQAQLDASPSPKRKQAAARALAARGGGSSPADAAQPAAAPYFFEAGPTLVPGGAERPLLTAEMAALITDYLPVIFRVVSNSAWHLAFTPKVHGMSLQTLYRALEEKTYTVLVVQDSAGHVFGGFCTQPWVPGGRKGFFGSGEAFVFSFGPPAAEGALQLRCHSWCGKTSDNCFQYADQDYFAMGGGERHALAVQADFLHGFSCRSSTFDSEPLASEEEFAIRDFEVWSLEEKAMPRIEHLDVR